ncbi:MAG: L,D-transpeptidase [Ignavibacteriales bacterium]|nr:L,D-transpeptidase [Ignavibacteriales bacterium]MCB9219200.1 L,D-transpeptidase [Ignavibacteriales bacterium]MCB9259782.1 L,D-transpeptidase [Ignavibacteriales bacterium]
MLRNVIYIMSSIILFFFGIIVYGVIINLRETPLKDALEEKEITKISNPSIVVDRRNYTLNLYSDTILVKQYSAVFGRNSGSVKLSKSDFITPTGKYKICKIDTNYTYYKKLYLDFPNLADASEALRNKIITKDEFLQISNSLSFNQCSSGNTVLGADIGIQGIGEYDIIFRNLPFVFNWTNGSIAISNENIDELLSVVNIGTKVTIKN